MNTLDKIPCEKCKTLVHVGVASKSHSRNMMHVCLSCLYDKRYHINKMFNIWTVLEDQRFEPS